MDSSDDASGGSCVVVSVVDPLALVMRSFRCRWRRRWGNRPDSVVDFVALSHECACPPLSAGGASSAFVSR